MYTVTFYSFKGGVGRTMAMANVAIELAERGRKVLVVDFDLEAPGLHTFDLYRTPEGMPGLIEYVSEFMRTNEAPDVTNYLYRSDRIGGNGGELWIMPSGCDRPGYQAMWRQIDWLDLYKNHNGFLLFEDLKQQWEHICKPDYVLIDSRTGYTDTAGICTRQLPDAVVTLFFPNDQNLLGLKDIIQDIRTEKPSSERDRITIHFVASNVPDLDDEEQILEKILTRFRNELEMDNNCIIHHYNSLRLLRQDLAVKELPKSSLAKEYRKLTDQIVERNVRDRDGALKILRDALDVRRRVRKYREVYRLEDDILEISKLHEQDGEISYNIGLVKLYERQFEAAEKRLSEAINLGHSNPDVFLVRAQAREALHKKDEAAGDAVAVISNEASDNFQREVAIRLLRAMGNGVRPSIVTSIAALPDEQQVQVASSFQWSKTELRIAIKILEPIYTRKDISPGLQRRARTLLSLAFIGLGRASEAVALLEPCVKTDVGSIDIVDHFNYAMAIWAKCGEPPLQEFKLLSEREQDVVGRSAPPNHLQCMALIYGVVGKTKAATEFLRKARNATIGLDGDSFSCWRYLEVSAEDFLQDLNDIQSLIEGKPVVPRFFETTAD